MPRRLVVLAFALALTMGALPVGALGTAAPVVASDSVTVVGSIPNATAIAAAFASDAPIMYLHTLNGLVTYDISDPTLPVPLATLPLPNFQNEAMSLGERADGTKFVIVGFDIYGVTPQDQTVALDYELVIIDVTDPTNPQLRGRTKTESSAHTVSCADPECYIAYTSGAYEPFFNPIDLSDLDAPKQLPQIRSIAQEGHDWDRDAAGLQWHVGTEGAVAYDTTDPLNPFRSRPPTARARTAAASTTTSSSTTRSGPRRVVHAGSRRERPGRLGGAGARERQRPAGHRGGLRRRELRQGRRVLDVAHPLPRRRPVRR